MSNEDVVKMIECIKEHVFCEDANRGFDYCQETDCTECQIDFCIEELNQGKMLVF